MTINVGVVGYGTIGKRVADVVMLQSDMKLIGVTGNSYNFRMEIANSKNIPIYGVEGTDKKSFEDNGIKLAGEMDDLLDAVDIIVDCTPKKIGKVNKEKYYVKKGVKAIFQGGEKASVAEVSFVAQCNYKEALNKDYVRVVSCNTTGICRTLDALDKAFGIESVHATFIRRAADPGDIKHGPINSIVPVLELPSHHGPDVQTVMKDLEIFTTALSVPSTLMHMHNITVDLKKEITAKDALDLWKKTRRIRIVRNAEKIRSTAEIVEFARDLKRHRGDMPEICIWEEGVGTNKKKLFYMQAVHQESDVVPENIDCIRAMMGFEDAKKSMDMTDESMGL